MTEQVGIESVNPATVVAPSPQAQYSQATRVGPWLFISGQLGVDVEGCLVGEDTVAQAAQAFENIRLILEAAGGTVGQLVRLTYYVTNIDDRVAIREARQRLLKNTFPAATMVEVSRLAMGGATIEIEATAYVG